MGNLFSGYIATSSRDCRRTVRELQEEARAGQDDDQVKELDNARIQAVKERRLARIRAAKERRLAAADQVRWTRESAKAVEHVRRKPALWGGGGQNNKKTKKRYVKSPKGRRLVRKGLRGGKYYIYKGKKFYLSKKK
jgi:hypothetical protein